MEANPGQLAQVGRGDPADGGAGEAGGKGLVGEADQFAE